MVVWGGGAALNNHKNTYLDLECREGLSGLVLRGNPSSISTKLHAKSLRHQFGSRIEGLFDRLLLAQRGTPGGFGRAHDLVELR